MVAQETNLMTRRRVLLTVLVIAVALVLTATVTVFHNSRDRHPGYTVDLRIEAGPPAPVAVGFAARKITPSVEDAWTDLNGNARFDSDEPWEDGNGNGRFDAVWLAGFHNRRPARGVHDDLWARAIVLDDGRTRVAIVSLDAIGLMHDQVVDIRNRVADSLGLDYVVVCSTHTHQAPDLMGLWGSSSLRSGIDPGYLELVVDQAAAAVAEAARKRRPAVLRFAQLPQAAADLVMDTRLPNVLDPGLRMLQAVDGESGDTLGVLIAWANHPETAWSENLLVSSDYVHFVRESFETGVRDGERLDTPGLGGVAVFVNGAIGGLMSTVPGFPIHDPFSDVVHRDPSFAKARAQGQRLARLGLEALRSNDVMEVREASIALQARTLELPLDNRLLLLGAALGVVPRGFVQLGVIRTEVAAFRVGPASFLMVPGEIYPEIVNGGIESPEGADFAVDPVEVPPLRQRMPGRVRFVIGQANDAIGYIIPKSEWDDEPPWLDGAAAETYGEIVSIGPDTAPGLHGELLQMLERLANDGS
jgi:hypothetical protein